MEKPKKPYKTAESEKLPRPAIPLHTRFCLWVCSGGRCQYKGCNKLLYQDDLTKEKFNISNIAHIVSHDPNGPRGDSERSAKLATCFSNLMLMCQDHHFEIDQNDGKNFSEATLHEFKRKHEERIKKLTSIDYDRKTKVIRFVDDIRYKQTRCTAQDSYIALSRNWYPDDRDVDICFSQILSVSPETTYQVKPVEIVHRINNLLQDIRTEQSPHLSIFAIASIPLLIYFGRQLGDALPAQVYQLHRATSSWEWSEPKNSLGQLVVEMPEQFNEEPILVISISDHVNISGYMADVSSFSVYTIRADSPSTAFIQQPSQLTDFKRVFRNSLIKIKKNHPDKKIKLFPAIPVSIAVELGRTISLKSDPHLEIYDFDRANGGWSHALTV